MQFRVVETTWRKAASQLVGELRGRMFHVTSPSAFVDICATGSILNNKNGQFRYNSSNNYYFKNIGCVSVVDLVNNIRPRITKRKMLSDYSIFEQFYPVVVFLFLSETVFPRVITWHRYQSEKAFGQQIVPELESGVPGEIDLSEISEVWFLSLMDRVELYTDLAKGGLFQAMSGSIEDEKGHRMC